MRKARFFPFFCSIGFGFVRGPAHAAGAGAPMSVRPLTIQFIVDLSPPNCLRR